jgi:NAD(P)-dependent dehydrogenase (short-subunit alcohol dehydrogenase family)
VLPFGSRTKQDLEPFMGVHCVATLLFTESLLPQLRAAAAATTTPGQTRVIWTSSALMDNAAPQHGVDFSVLDQGFKNRITNYGASKAATWFLAREFARRHGNDQGAGGILSVALNPGGVRAGSYKGTSASMYFVLDALLLHEPVLGAYTELYAGLSNELTLEHNGEYVIPWGRRRPDDEITRKDLLEAMKPVSRGGLGYAEKFWEWCEEQWKPHI